MDEYDQLVEQLYHGVRDFVRRQTENGRPFVTKEEIYVQLGFDFPSSTENKMFTFKNNKVVEYHNTKILHFPANKITNKNI